MSTMYEEIKADSINRGIITAFCKAMEVRDEYTMRHNENVARLMSCLAEYMGLSDGARFAAYLIGIVHDIGKLGVPELVLNKRTRLTEAEFELIKDHPIIGAEILNKIVGFEEVAKIVYHHHERYDGTGYPDKLYGRDIPFMSRMLALCDAYDAMVSNRCYKMPMTHEQAVDEIRQCMGSQFDPAIAVDFLNMMRARYSSEIIQTIITNGH